MRRVSQHRRIALLALIAASPDGTISRDRVLGLLWPDRDERTARHLLADSLYVLRRTLGQTSITATGESLRLSADVLSCDVVDFRRALAEERWSDALTLYAGDFLDGFFVRNAAEFDQWALSERNRLRSLAVRAGSSLTTRLELAGEMTEATSVAARTLELNPSDEMLFRNLFRLLIETENRSTAANVARSFIERVALDGTAPSAETLRLLREARAIDGAELVVVVPASRAQRGTHTIDSITASLIARGRHQWHQRTRAAIERAIGYFARAVDRDPRATDGWCGLADSWTVLGGRGYAPMDLAATRAAESANRALALDDSSSAVHASLGGVEIVRRRWDAAEAALRNAIRIDSRNADAHHWLSMVFLTGFGARERAIREQAIAATLNPISAIQVGALGWQRYLAGAYELSRKDMEPVVDLNADLEEAHAGVARAAARLGDEKTVMETIAAGLSRRNDLRGNLLAEQASALALLGDSARARRLATSARVYGATPINLALAWATLGEGRRALEWLERDGFRVYWAPHAVWWDPRFDDVRDDARFVRIRERVDRVWDPEWR